MDLSMSRRRKPIVRNDSDSDDDYSQLGCSSTYTITKKIPSLSEQEKEDEAILCDNINQINNSLKSQGKTMLSSPLSNNTTISTLDDTSTEISKFYSQNIINYDDKIKIIVIGKAKTGKSLLISKLIDKNSTVSCEYAPTTGLDIRKTNISIDGLNVKLEVMDTNESIVNSKIIRTYYQVCNGCMIVTEDFDKDYEFIEKQVEIMHSISSEPNIMILVNNRSKDVNSTASVSEINNLVRKYYISNKVKSDLSKFNRDDDVEFKSFVKKMIIKKNINDSNWKSKEGIKTTELFEEVKLKLKINSENNF